MTDEQSSEIDISVPQSARIWNYWLGGKDNYPADRAAGDEVLGRIPDIAVGAQAERAFLVRVVRHLVGDRRHPPVPRRRDRPADDEQHP